MLVTSALISQLISIWLMFCVTEARRHGSYKKYQKIAVLHRIAHRLNVVTSILLAVRCLDPVGTYGIYKQYSTSILSHNSATALVSLAGAYFYSTLRAGFAMSVISGPGAAIMTLIDRIFKTMLGILLLVANLTILLRLAVVDRFWNYGLYLVFNATTLLTMLILFNIGSAKLRRSLLEVAESERQRRTFALLPVDTAATAVSAPGTDPAVLPPVLDSEENLRDGHEMSSSVRSTPILVAPSSPSSSAQTLAVVPPALPPFGLAADNKRNSGTINAQRRLPKERDRMGQMTKSLRKLTKVQVWANLISISTVLAGYFFGFNSLNAKQHDTQPTSNFVFQSWSFFWLQIAALILAVWYSWVPNSLALFWKPSQELSILDSGASDRSKAAGTGDEMRGTMTPDTGSVDGSVDGDDKV